jgi:hypothetical protein
MKCHQPPFGSQKNEKNVKIPFGTCAKVIFFVLQYFSICFVRSSNAILSLKTKQPE